MTGMQLPHAAVFVVPEPRQPHPAEIMPELYADPDLNDRPVGLLCELVTCFGEDLAVQVWAFAHAQLRTEKRRLIASLTVVVRQLGVAA